MKVTKFTVNPFGENTYIAWNDDTRHAVIIDPGMMQQHERDVVTRFIEDNNLVMQQVLLTHGHIDHVASARWMADLYGIPVAASPLDAPWMQQLPQQAQHFRLRVELEPLTIDTELKDGDQLMTLDEPLHVLAVPGHSRGGLTFYAPESALAFTGDSIFEGSIGRTDLDGGDLDQLLTAVRRQILTLPDHTLLAPGHGGPTTVIDERTYNPYL